MKKKTITNHRLWGCIFLFFIISDSIKYKGIDNIPSGEMTQDLIIGITALLFYIID